MNKYNVQSVCDLAGAVSPEDLIQYAHRISQASSVVSPLGWQLSKERERGVREGERGMGRGEKVEGRGEWEGWGEEREREELGEWGEEGREMGKGEWDDL